MLCKYLRKSFRTRKFTPRGEILSMSLMLTEKYFSASLQPQKQFSCFSIILFIKSSLRFDQEKERKQHLSQLNYFSSFSSLLLLRAVCAGNPDAKRLYDDLLSNYNKLVRPVVNVTDALTVRIKLKLSQLIDVVGVYRECLGIVIRGIVGQIKTSKLERYLGAIHK